jgi:hypothetical protein
VSAVAATDALAKHFRDNVTGTKQAYSTGITAGSLVLPGDIFDTPVVLCMWQGVTVAPGSFERVHHTVSAEAWFNGADTAAAYQTYVAFVDAVLTSIRSNWTLDGAVTQVSSWSAGSPEDVEVNGKPYVRLSFSFDLLEAGPQTYAP